MILKMDVLEKRLQALMGDVHFWSDFDKALDTQEQLLEIGEHNIREYEKFEALDEERKERIWSLMSTILASGLQKEVVDKYGTDDAIAVRKFFEDLFRQPDNQAYWDQLRQTAEQGLLGSGLPEEQCRVVMKNLIDRLPELIRECLEELYFPSRFLPRSEAQPVATVLADMMKEEAAS